MPSSTFSQVISLLNINTFQLMKMEQILNDKKFQQQLRQLAAQKGTFIDKINKEAATYLKELYTVQKPLTNLVSTQLMEYVLSRGYDSTIDGNPSEIKWLTKLMRKHPVAFVMTHKTYIDMFVLAVVLARYGLPLPHIFAGINMSFAGTAQLGRQAGVIYIRRSFKDNIVYKATLRHFIATLINEKDHFMWAIEGTRSRTGKLVWPKMGILKYIMEGEQDSKQKVKYVPVSIVYDLIPDVKKMTEEGRGKNKRPESLTWFINYIRKMGDGFGRISIRFGTPVENSQLHAPLIPDSLKNITSENNTLPRFAFGLVHRINQITPVTTTSLICISLLSKYSLTKRAIESNIANLMQFIETHKADALVDRGKPIGESVQIALKLLKKAEIIKQIGDTVNAKYAIIAENYLQANYYANMAVHHLYHSAFIELALVKLLQNQANTRVIDFWTDIMQMRDLFKFEFFYSGKPEFTDEIEDDFAFIDDNWQDTIANPNADVMGLLQQQKIFVAPAVLFNYIEAYRVVGHGLLTWNTEQIFDKQAFLEFALSLGEEMHWQGRIRRIEAVSKPFLINGIRYAQNQNLIPSIETPKKAAIQRFLDHLDDLAQRINQLQGITLQKPAEATPAVPIERDIVPGSKTDTITKEILESEGGPHIGAFFDLDKTLIKDFSAKEFFQTRLLSGKVTAKELVAQFAGVLVYATGNGNFSGLAAISAKGIKGVKEQVFIDLGEEVYQKYLAASIYPEARAMVAAHMAQGHTVAIISAATPYQVNPIARDLGIEHVMCTRMQVHNGKFTGKIIEPACWGEGKAYAAQQLAQQFNLDLNKSYFYTDSASDLPLLEIVGKPRPMNPNPKLSAIAFQNDWPVYRFNDESHNTIANVIRTGLALGSVIPAAMVAVTQGTRRGSWREGVNSMMATVGDLTTALAGIRLSVKGEEHLWSHRPAVFIFNHQSSADMFIASKLVRKDARGIAKKELQLTPILGQLMQASGVIFIDRKNKDKAIEAMKPAVDALKKGTSIIIFPEGTRSYNYQLGKFKKGAFHLAMQADVPLVPVIIKNAHDAMPRGTNLFRPTVVEIIVLPPISTENWAVADLNDHITQVRGLYLRELGQIEED